MLFLKGTTLEKISKPDETIEHTVNECKKCHNNLQSQDAQSYESRQVFEAIIKLYVIEHKSEVKECAKCETVTTGAYPKEVSKSVQYGNSVKVLSVYLSQGQLIPYRRVEDFFKDE